jgi:hypothetical protein
VPSEESFGQLAQLIVSIGYVGKIDDFSIKPIEQYSFLLTSFSWHTPSRPSSSGTTVSTAAEAGRIYRDIMRTRPQYAEALVSQGSELSRSDGDDGLTDNEPDLSSDDDRCSSKDKQGLSTRINIPWDAVDE